LDCDRVRSPGRPVCGPLEKSKRRSHTETSRCKLCERASAGAQNRGTQQGHEGGKKIAARAKGAIRQESQTVEAIEPGAKKG
jgi:hypothetical protein